MDAHDLVAALNAAAVRYVVIGVAGANYWARSGHTVFTTKDLDIPWPDSNSKPAFATRRTFVVEGVPIAVARLRDIVASKAAAGREKDRLFLATHAEALRALIESAD